MVTGMGCRAVLVPTAVPCWGWQGVGSVIMRIVLMIMRGIRMAAGPYR